MEKIPTIFIRRTDQPQLASEEPNPNASWIFAGEGTPTRKKDGANVRIDVEWSTSSGCPSKTICLTIWKRRNPNREEKARGEEPGYVLASRADPADKHIFAAVDATCFFHWPTGCWPCEALGPKIQGGIESSVPCLYPFSFKPEALLDCERTFADIRGFLREQAIEGIVWHHPDGRMAKIKRRDFGFPWPVK